jgi:hypothetical protein
VLRPARVVPYWCRCQAIGSFQVEGEKITGDQAVRLDHREEGRGFHRGPFLGWPK